MIVNYLTLKLQVGTGEYIIDVCRAWLEQKIGSVFERCAGNRALIEGGNTGVLFYNPGHIHCDWGMYLIKGWASVLNECFV